MKNLASGEVTQITNTSGAGMLRLSPDGKMLAYFDYGVLNWNSFESMTTETIDDNVDDTQLAWSLDSSRIAFLSYRNGTGEVFVMRPLDRSQAVVPGATGDLYYISWSADARHIMYDLVDDAGSESVWSVDSQEQTPPVRIMPDLHVLWDLENTKAGSTAVHRRISCGGFHRGNR